MTVAATGERKAGVDIEPPALRQRGRVGTMQDVQGVPKLMALWRGLRTAHVHIVPYGKTVTSDFYVSAEGNGSVGDRASNAEHASDSAAVKLGPDMSQGIF